MKNDNWESLAELASKASGEESTDMPFGFDTRVVARWLENPMPSLRRLWEWNALRFLAASSVIMLICLVTTSITVAADRITTPELDVVESLFDWHLEP